MTATTDEAELLLTELKENDVKVTGEAAEKMKENIENDKGGGDYLGVGTHDVFIESVELFKSKSGTLGMRFNVENPEGKNDASFWLSEPALPYTIQNVSRLVVHNVEKDKKDDARTFMKNVTTASEIFEVAKTKLIGASCVLVISESDTQTYTNNDGVTKPSLDKNLQTWKPKQDIKNQKAMEVLGGGEVTKDNLDEFPFK